MSFFGAGTPSVSFSPSSSPSAAPSKHLTPPPSPRLGIFTSYNPSLSQKNNYNPYHSSLKSPTLLPCTIPVPLQANETPGATTSAPAMTNGTAAQDASSANASATACPSNLYESFLMKATNIISANRSFSDSPPGSPKLPPLSPFSSPPPISSPSSSSTSAAATASSSSSSPFPSQMSLSVKLRNDPNNNSRNRPNQTTANSTTTTSITTSVSCAISTSATSTSSGITGVRPPTSIMNVSPYKYQLRAYLYPRHITTEHVIFSHRTKVSGRSLYFFSPATRGGLSKPVFTTRETLAHMLEPGSSMDDADETESVSRLAHLGSPSHSRRRRSGDLLAGAVCTMKRVHLQDPACDLGICVWRGRGPREGLPAPHSPPTPLGPALLVEAVHQRDGHAVAAAVGGDVLYLLPARPDLEPRSTEICVQDAVIACVGEGVVWYHVRNYTRRKVTPLNRGPGSPKLTPLARRGLRGSLSVDSRNDTL
ncbi:hypothetical protein FHG87_001975 [Trinorchestia longiramus]|nr:hypothetical protein FHG87_001975 [Trinorchestia longiramus]